MEDASNFEDHPVSSTTGQGQAPFPDLMVNPLDTEGAKRVSESAEKFKALATGGGFAINDAGFEAYNKVCDEFLAGYDKISIDFYRLITRAKMGSSDYAGQVADYNVKVAHGDGQALIPNLELLKESIKQVQEALAIAKANYSAADSEHAQTFSGIGKADS
ncbi:hypothetical protein [Amycolatopsis sp. NPDC050768]|uniref:hypothetical protein n=1 Tax=Amycolatopsis sp. NPDC050768 TaxID=3154839 RepID=UPI0033EB215E